METKNSLVGTVLVHSWGYSMTIVDFYEIVSETAHQVKLKKLAQDEVATGFLVGTTTPCDPREYIVDRLHDGAVVYTARKPKLGGFYRSALGKSRTHFLREWDGTPQHFNHCD